MKRWLSAGGLSGVFANAGLLMGGKGFNAVIMLATLALAARSLGVEIFGALVLITTFAQAAADIAKFQTWQVLLQYGQSPLLRGDVGCFQPVLRFSVLLDALSGAFAVLGSLLTVYFAWPWLGWPEHLRSAALWYMSSVLFLVPGTPLGVLRATNRFDLLALRSGVAALLRLLGVLLAAWQGWGIEVFLLIWYITSAASLLLSMQAAQSVLARRGLLQGWHWWRGRLTPEIPGLWRFVWRNNLNLSLGVASTQLFVLMVGSLVGTAEAGLFHVGRQLAEGLSKAGDLLVAALYPELVRLREGADIRGLRRAVLRVSMVSGGIATVLLLLLSGFAGTLLEWLLGAPVASGAFAVWLCAAAVVRLWALPLEPLLISTNRIGVALRARFWMLLVQIPTGYWLTKHYGLLGAATVAVLVAVLGLVLLAFPLWRWFRRQDVAQPA